MLRCALGLLAVLLGFAGVLASRGVEPAHPAVRAIVVPIHDEIAEPVFYVLRRALKEASADGDQVVVLDLKTPGGALNVTTEIMDALTKFPGTTIAYVDDEAMSAGAIIAGTTDEIWFAPRGVMGAAAPVTSSGQDIDATMKEKLVSYMTARMRAVSAGHENRGQVLSAMIDADSELTIDGQVIKPKGSLLSLTAAEAVKTYGKPPKPLLAAGIAPSVDALLEKKYGAGNFSVQTLNLTWSERLAVVMNEFAPVLLGLGLFSLFIAFKTSSFETFGVAGGALLALVFLSSYLAGLSGHEPMVLFALGMILIALEVVFFHSAGLLGAGGVVLVLLSLIWGLADIWPHEPLQVAWSGDAFERPLLTVVLGVALAIMLGIAALRFLPEGWVLDRLVIGATVKGSAQVSSVDPAAASTLEGLIGRRGVAATALRPGGQVEIAGRRYEASVPVGAIEPGAAVVVRGRRDFSLVVERAESA